MTSFVLFARFFHRAIAVLTLAAGVLVTSATAAQSNAALDAVLVLPEFKVVSDRPLPMREEWSYVKIGNFEVISSTSERITKQFVKDLHEFQIVLSAVAPHMLIRAELPVMVVLCGKPGQFQRFSAPSRIPGTRGRNTSLVRDSETASIIIDYHARQFIDEMMIPIPGRSDTLVGRQEIHSYNEFVRQYIHLSLGQMTPRLPAWVAEGMANIYADIEFTNKWIQVGLPKSFRNEYVVDAFNSNTGSFGTNYPSFDSFSGVAWSSSSNYGDLFTNQPRVYVQPIYIMPLEKLFNIGYDSSTLTATADSAASDLDAWRKQATAFVHMCVYGRGGRYRQAFTKFSSLTASQPPTEALFKECFGKSYKEMALELRGYTEFTDYQSTIFEAKKGENILTPKPVISLRPATDGEIGRIKGETFRLSGQDEAARNEFVLAYLRGDREPGLLGSLGLMAHQRNDDARARTYLEALATAPQTISRPRAYLELARLRRAAFQAANKGRPLEPSQLAAVLTPLFDAIKLPQQLSAIYLEIAYAWDNTSVIPERDNLAALEQGVRYFPRNGDLIVATARQLIKHGYKADAAPMVLRALNNTRDADLKQQLETLRQLIDGGNRTSGTLRVSPESNLSAVQREQLAAYRAAKTSALTELRTKLSVTAALSPEQRERELANFATSQTPRLRAIEADAAHLEIDLGWPPDDPDDLGLADVEAPARGSNASELAALQGALLKSQGLSPPQLGLVREMILEAHDGAASRGAFFFSPATARVRLPAGLPATLNEQIATFTRTKDALKQELRGLLVSTAASPQAEVTRSVSLSALAQEQSRRFEALEQQAEAIRRALAPQTPPFGAPTATLPAALAERLVTYQQNRTALQRDIRRELRSIRAQAPAETEIAAVGEPPQLSLKSNGRASAAALAPLRTAIDAFNRDFAERFSALDRELAELRRAISAQARPTASSEKSMDDLMRDFASAAFRQIAGEAYRDYRAAVFEPGLSIEQRRLLFGSAAEKQRSLVVEF